MDGGLQKRGGWKGLGFQGLGLILEGMMGSEAWEMSLGSGRPLKRLEQ